MEEFTLIVASWVIRAIWREIQRFVLEFKASLFFRDSYIWCFLFEKSNLRVQRNSTLNLECKEVRDQIKKNPSIFPYIFCHFGTVELQKMYGESQGFRFIFVSVCAISIQRTRLSRSPEQAKQMCYKLLVSHWEVMTRLSIFCGFCFWGIWFALWRNSHREPERCIS